MRERKGAAITGDGEGQQARSQTGVWLLRQGRTQTPPPHYFIFFFSSFPSSCAPDRITGFFRVCAVL